MMKVGFDPAPNESNTTENTKSVEVKVIMGVFFDGTGNNKRNIDFYRKQKSSLYKWWLDDSYKQGYSNVACKYDSYKHTLKPENGYYIRRVYITGPGTDNRSHYIDASYGEKSNVELQGKVDSKYYKNKEANPELDTQQRDDMMNGNAFGLGGKGVVSKVLIANRYIRKELGFVLDLAAEDGLIGTVELQLDVYGFSRGSAAARCFVNNIKGHHGTDKGILNDHCLNNQLNVWGYENLDNTKINVDIKVRFLGLYDTVSSYGFNFLDDVKELGLDYPSGGVNIDRVVHFCAGDEYRDNFSLTTMDSYPNLKQIIFPGAHSDVGGGYAEQVSEDFWMYNRVWKIPKPWTWINRGDKNDSDLVSEGWFVNEEKVRTVKNDYQYIPLLRMLELLGDSPQVTERKKTDEFLGHINSCPILKEAYEMLTVNKLENSPLYSIKKVKNFIMKDGLIDREEILSIVPNYSLKKGDGLKIYNIRHDYIHLSVSGNTGMEARNNNHRLVIKDNE